MGMALHKGTERYQLIGGLMTKQYKKWSVWKQSPPLLSKTVNTSRVCVCFCISLICEYPSKVTFFKVIFLACDPKVRLWLCHCYPQSLREWIFFLEPDDSKPHNCSRSIPSYECPQNPLFFSPKDSTLYGRQKKQTENHSPYRSHPESNLKTSTKKRQDA